MGARGMPEPQGEQSSRCSAGGSAADPQGRWEGTWTVPAFGTGQKKPKPRELQEEPASQRPGNPDVWTTQMFTSILPQVAVGQWQAQLETAGAPAVAGGSCPCSCTLPGMKGALLWPGHREETPKFLHRPSSFLE